MQAQLLPHQEVVKDFIIQNPYCGIFVGIGGAKTLSTLAALEEIQPSGHILVIAPLAIARSTWIDEIEKWNINVRTQSFIVDDNDKKLSKQKRLELFDSLEDTPPTMYFINRELLYQPSRTKKVPRLNDKFFTLTSLDSLAHDICTYLSTLPYATKGEVIEHIALQNAIPKTQAKASFDILESQDVISYRNATCPTCNGKSCANCAFGLLNQLPIKNNTLVWPFKTVIIDESQGFKDPRTNRFKALKAVRPQIERLIELTGTPAPNSLLDLWAQIYLLDQGASLGKSFGRYKQEFFYPTMYVDNRPVKWALRTGCDTEIYKRISPLTISTTNTALPLPPVSYNNVNVSLSKPLMAAYKDFARERVLELLSQSDNSLSTITADSSAILHAKLIQFASGSMYTDANHNYKTIHTEKLQMLEHLMSQVDSPTLIAYRFISEKELIYEYLNKLGINAAIFDTTRSMVHAWNNQEYDALILHPASAGPGLNLQAGGHNLIWYTLPDSLEHYQQLNGRLIRIGQNNHVNISYMTVKGTLDAKTPKLLDMKDQVQRGLLSALDVQNYDMSLTQELIATYK